MDCQYPLRFRLSAVIRDLLAVTHFISLQLSAVLAKTFCWLQIMDVGVFGKLCLVSMVLASRVMA